MKNIKLKIVYDSRFKDEIKTYEMNKEQFENFIKDQSIPFNKRWDMFMNSSKNFSNYEVRYIENPKEGMTYFNHYLLDNVVYNHLVIGSTEINLKNIYATFFFKNGEVNLEQVKNYLDNKKCNNKLMKLLERLNLVRKTYNDQEIKKLIIQGGEEILLYNIEYLNADINYNVFFKKLGC